MATCEPEQNRKMLSDKTVDEVEMGGGQMAVPSEGSFQGVPSSKQGDPEINQVSFKVPTKSAV